MTGCAGTFHWMAPEILQSQSSYTYKADVEAEKSMLVNVLKGLDIANEGHYETPEFNQKENYVEERPNIGQQYMSDTDGSIQQQSQGRITQNSSFNQMGNKSHTPLEVQPPSIAQNKGQNLSSQRVVHSSQNTYQ